uniref:DNA-directed RNA polymerase III subunit RPC6 n=2 Tax=Clastoptera arizonana TaxID=38151 RepID=A0A1B6DXE9_9HEMI
MADEQKLGDEQRVVALIQASGTKGVSDSDIQKEFPQINAAQRVIIINKLITEGFLDLFNEKGGLVYKLKSTVKTEKLKNADNEERIVYSIIEEAGNKGIWIRDIRFKSNLMPTTLGKILKQLENKKIIKAVKSVAASKKKVYMLYNLEPDRSLTGGSWYCNQDFEVEFVDVLNQQCYRYLQQRKEKTVAVAAKNGPLAAQAIAFASTNDVWKYITELGISKVILEKKEIKTILDTLLYDGKVERTINVDGDYLYRAVESFLPPPGIIRMPCGICPVMRNCSDVGSVNPKKCVYLTEWLS